jgi:hypothetical protein
MNGKYLIVFGTMTLILVASLVANYVVFTQNESLTTQNGIIVDKYNNLTVEFNKLLGQLQQNSGIQGTNNVKLNITGTITVSQNGKVIRTIQGDDPLTTYGETLVLDKLTGNATYYNATQYVFNCTWITIGDGSVSAASTVLPWEWDRVVASFPSSAMTATSFNMTVTFTPPQSGLKANCMGINCQSATANTTDLVSYITFTEITGIDATFTFTLNMEIAVTTS